MYCPATDFLAHYGDFNPTPMQLESQGLKSDQGALNKTRRRSRKQIVELRTLFQSRPCESTKNGAITYAAIGICAAVATLTVKNPVRNDVTILASETTASPQIQVVQTSKSMTASLDLKRISPEKDPRFTRDSGCLRAQESP